MEFLDPDAAGGRLARDRSDSVLIPMIIHHVTLITGDVATHRLDLISEESVQACRSLLPKGGEIPQCSPFMIEITGPVFTVSRGRDPVVVCGIGSGRDITWDSLVDLQSRFAPVVASAPRSQWLAVVLLPGLASIAREDISWLGDFERCMAAAILLKS